MKIWTRDGEDKGWLEGMETSRKRDGRVRLTVGKGGCDKRIVDRDKDGQGQ